MLLAFFLGLVDQFREPLQLLAVEFSPTGGIAEVGRYRLLQRTAKKHVQHAAQCRPSGAAAPAALGDRLYGDPPVAA